MKNKKGLLIIWIRGLVRLLVFATTVLVFTKLAFAQVQHQSAVKKTSSSGVPYHIGDCYGGGVVFFVNKNPDAPVGRRGLIVAVADVVGSYAWDTQAAGQDVPKTEATLFSGGVNSATILGKIGSKRAQAVSASQRYTDGTYHDWYLPSKQELSTIYFSALAKGPHFWAHCRAKAPSAATYWSSTQDTASTAWGVSFAGGVVVVAHKNNPFLVRPVREF